jgi:hypothetical protein
MGAIRFGRYGRKPYGESVEAGKSENKVQISDFLAPRKAQGIPGWLCGRRRWELPQSSFDIL